MPSLSIFIKLFLLLGISTTYAQHSLNAENLTVSTFHKVLRQGELAELLDEVRTNKALQFERLVAYFFHQRINKYRLENGLTTLYWDDRMWLAARNHNLYLLKLNALTHTQHKTKPFFSGVSPSDRIQYVMYNGFKMESFAENCLLFEVIYAKVAEDAKEIAERAFEQWRNSPGHNKNMLLAAHFAHGTSFIVEGTLIFGTTNFGNASDFEPHEIAITWDADLAKPYPPDVVQNRKTFSPFKWTLQFAEEEIMQVIKSKMPKQRATHNNDFRLAAEMGMNDLAANNKSKSAKKRYIKSAKKTQLKYLFAKMHEISIQQNFGRGVVENKSALKMIDDQISKLLAANTKIISWGATCSLKENNNGYSCNICIVYVSD